jgi:hypothetical protein
MANFGSERSAGLRFLLIVLALALLPACDPPLKFTPETSATAQNSAADATAADADLDAADPAALPASGSVVLIGGWSKTSKKPNVSTATAEFFDPSTKKFSALGSMPLSEGAGAAALLTTGVPAPEILVAGGFSGSSQFTHKTVSNKVVGSTIDQLELFDPATGTFSAATANLLAKRFGATATTLASGKVLIAGGADGTGTPLATAEVFDPSTGITTATSNNMSNPRAFHTATLLNDGTVLIAGGGIDSIGTLTNTADIYDPASNSFTPTGSMSIARAAHTAVVLTTGTPGDVFICGGASSGGGLLFAIASAEIYDPVTKVFSSSGSHMNDLRAFHSATVLSSGKILLVGGFDNFDAGVNGGTGRLSSLFGTTLKSAEIYDPVADSFTCVPGKGKGGFVCHASMKVARAAHTATLFPTGPLADEVLIAGGLGAPKPNSTSSELNEAELYNPATNAFTKVGNLVVARGLDAAVLLP